MFLRLFFFFSFFTLLWITHAPKERAPASSHLETSHYDPMFKI
jgi:hypothetical protein